jgi:predicted metal-dependent enzyme (double-stranded beta helix superfamily)
MMVMPHDHRMWAVIGIYSGREDNIYWRRVPGVSSRIEASGAQALCERDAVALDDDVIHSVINPIGRLTGAIHIYGGGDFIAQERSEWDAMTLDEHRLDHVRRQRDFAEANARYEASLRAKAG